MLIISVINRSQRPNEEVQRYIRAVNRQLAEDFAAHWHRNVRLRLEGSSQSPNVENPRDLRGGGILYLVDDDGEDALGWHDLNARGIPYGFVSTKLAAELLDDAEKWSVILSHEALELAVDPEVNLFARGPHPEDPSREVLHWYEVCDAVQDETYEIDGVAVSNFVLPLFFTIDDEHGGRNDFLGETDKRPDPLPSFGVAPGGYLGFFDPGVGDHDT